MELMEIDRAALAPMEDFVTEAQWEKIAHADRVINIQQVIEAGGFTKRKEVGVVYHVPVLAVTRLEGVSLHIWHDGSLSYSFGEEFVSATPSWCFKEGSSFSMGADFSSPCPPLPRKAQELMKDEKNLVLFEANWTAAPLDDPAIIRPIVGDLYQVLYTWDLTDAERAALKAGGVV